MSVDRSLQSVAKMRGVTLRHGKITALDAIDLDIPAGCTVGVIGPDGVGKSTLLSLISGSRKIQTGKVELFGGDMSDRKHRELVCPRIAYMPQGLGNHLYATLSVYENINFFGNLFGLPQNERRERIDELLEITELAPFKERLMGQLSGGMKQKLGICCALIHEPDILILDEPTTGVDPLSRRLFWKLIESIRSTRPGLNVVVATAYMEEAAGFDWLIAMDSGHLLFSGKVDQFLAREGSSSLEEAFISMLPKSKLINYKPIFTIPPRQSTTETFIEAHNLTKRFGDFTAVDHVNFKIDRGEIFGFVGSNGCGKTTTMKMLTGLLPPSEGEAKLFGHVLNPHDIETRKRVGYMSQFFSLYNELTVKQNLFLHARLFNIPEEQIPEKVEKIMHRFGIEAEGHSLPKAIPLGQRQRLSLAVAMIHDPEILILDEPTTGVDPIARDAFWQMMIELSRQDRVTIFISTHFMNEAERCDRVSLMHAGRVLATAPPSVLREQCKAKTLEDAFVKFLQDAGAHKEEEPSPSIQKKVELKNSNFIKKKPPLFSLQRMGAYIQREALELYRDVTRLALSVVGCIVLLVALSYGISVDVKNIPFAVLDRDQTDISRDYIYNLAASASFTERPPLKDYHDLDRRMRNDDISLAIEIPPNFASDILHGKQVSIGTWIDGAMPKYAETIRGYIQGANLHWEENTARKWLHTPQEPVSIEARFLYNPDVKSEKVIVPAAFAIILMMIPAILSALSVVREKEFGSIVNLYVSPTRRLEFLVGKQIPYIVIALINFFIMVILAYFIFGMTVKGSFLTLLLATILFVIISTAFGLLVSTFTVSQTAAIFATSILVLLPTNNLSGLLDPVSSLEGVGAFIGHIFPTSYYLTITRGVFSKGLGFHDLMSRFIPLLITIPILFGLSLLFLKKQER